jgi:hypothetical protein
MFKSQKGSSILALVILLFVFISGLLGFIWFYTTNASKKPVETMDTKTEVGSVTLDSKKEPEGYTPIKEEKGTPVEVNNSVVTELDAVMMDIDNSSDEDVSDLSL